MSIDKMKAGAIVLQGVLLAAGMLLLCGFAFGAYQHVGQLALFVSMAIIILVGFLIRRCWWRERKQAWKTTAIGFLLFALLQLILVLVFGEGGGFLSLLKATGMFMWIYVPWFWLPFAIGILAGGFRYKNGGLDKPEKVADVQPMPRL